MKAKIITEIICLLLVILFLYAGISKLMNLYLFRLQLGNSPWIGQFKGVLSIVLPVFELGVSIMILTGGRIRQAGLIIYAISLFTFSIYITAVLLYADHIPCSCGGLLPA